MNKDDLEKLLISCVPIRKDEDGDYVTILEKDADFAHNVAVFFVLDDSGGKLQMMATTDFSVGEAQRLDALAFCNKWNTEKSFGQAFFDEGRFRINAVLNDPGDLPADYVRKSFLQFYLPVFWMYYKEVGAEFECKHA